MVGSGRIDPVTCNTRQGFRRGGYARFGARRAALFALLDAAPVAGVVPSRAYLSLPPVHRPGGGSLDAALAAGRPDEAALRDRLGQSPLDDGQPVVALDTSVWPRHDAETSPPRGHSFSPSRQAAGQPIVTGWSSAWVAHLSFTHDRGTAPLDVRRVPPPENAQAVAAAPIRTLLRRPPAGAPVPLVVFDAGDAPETLARELGDLEGQRVAVLGRWRSGRCFAAAPSPATGSTGGRPRRHGATVACDDERTWWPPTAEHTEEHAHEGQVRVRAWAGVPAQAQNHPTTGSRRTKPTLRGTLVLVAVERLPRPTRLPRRLGLWWPGPGAPDLTVLWRASVHRFDLEHTDRFGKQTLNWTTPRVRHPEQADRGTGLVLLAYRPLRLARRTSADVRRPWERSQRPDRRALTPGRVRQALPHRLVIRGTPATSPKPCGRSPGRPKGRRSRPAPRFPALKKAA